MAAPPSAYRVSKNYWLKQPWLTFDAGQTVPGCYWRWRVRIETKKEKTSYWLSISSVTGLLLAGVGHVTDPPDSQRNFLVCDSRTERATIESAFNRFTKERKDIGIVLINQHIAEKIRDTVDKFQDAFPAVLEIPAKDHPYDPEKDSVLRRVRRLFGE